jgi:serine/threonine-protein kinase
MELVEGESLSAVLRRGPVPWPTAVGIAAQVAGALAAAHACGVVHCDVTPGNVMLSAEGVKIIDFGIASTAGDGADGVMFGTPAYLAPERRAGGCAVPASDVFGAGLLLYEMLAGRLPWPDGTATEVVAAHRNMPPAPLPDVPGLPARVRAMCRACLDVDPSRRPTSRELQICLAGVTRVNDPHGRRNLAGTTVGAEPVGVSMAAGASVAGGAPDGGTALPHSFPAPHAVDPAAGRPSGSRRGRTRIMPHGMTSVPDPGRATEPIDEPPPPPRRRRRAFFALPSLLLLAIVVAFGFTDARTTNGSAPAPTPSIQPESPGRTLAPGAPNQDSTGAAPDQQNAPNEVGTESQAPDQQAARGDGGRAAKQRTSGGHGNSSWRSPRVHHGVAPQPSASGAPDQSAGDGSSGNGAASAPSGTTPADGPPAPISCQISYGVVSSWSGGFTAQMTITNTGATDITGWTLTFRLDDGQRVGNGWNGDWTQDGRQVTVRDVGLNHDVAAGDSVTLGFVGLRDGADAGTGGDGPGSIGVPGSFSLNGTDCGS